MTRLTYTSTVVAPVQIGIAVLIAAGLIVLGVLLHPAAWPVMVIGAVLVIAGGISVATVRLAVDGTAVRIGPSPIGRRMRAIPVGEIAAAGTASIGWPEVFGLIPAGRRAELSGNTTALSDTTAALSGTTAAESRSRWRITRLTVRPGATLCLTLRDGERVRISTPDPEAALRLLDPDAAPATPPG